VPEEKAIKINKECFSSGALGTVEEKITKLTVGKFKEVFIQKIGHYLFDKLDLFEKLLNILYLRQGL
jgi:hypothetical protein